MPSALWGQKATSLRDERVWLGLCCFLCGSTKLPGNLWSLREKPLKAGMSEFVLGLCGVHTINPQAALRFRGSDTTIYTVEEKYNSQGLFFFTKMSPLGFFFSAASK